jgi:DNA topoisomerase I
MPKTKAKTTKYNNLLVVESPSKAKTINKYLGSDFKVMATVGHIIDLPKSQLGVDVDNNYEPQFDTIYGKGKVIKDIKKAIPQKGNVYLAMDPDREGEAIAWHLSNAINLKSPKRVTFHEITESAVKKAMEKPGDINENLVEAQKARRVLDRLVGYKLSELIWKKIWYGLSAGRVQSVALRLVVEKEEEREAFKEQEYWEVSIKLKDSTESILIAKLATKDGKKYVPKSKEEVESFEKEIGESKFLVKDVAKKEVKKHAYPPFTTSTMQQSANSILGFTSKRTMGIAQVLYQSGYITYMRTDSVFLSKKATDDIRKLVENRFGKEYIPEKPNYYKNRAKNAQEAHEAIRPTDFNLDIAQIEKEHGKPAAKLYELIWKRAVSSQMSDKKVEVLKVSLFPKDLKKPEYMFTMGGEKTLFEGFRKVLGTSKQDDDLQEIAKIKKGDELEKIEFVNEQKFTQPPARYTEASLIKKLEVLGIGRPSTYSSIISTIQGRGYIEMEGRSMFPTDVGRVVTNFLRDNFQRLVDYEYTAMVENELDDIALGKKKYVPVIDEEYKEMMKNIKKADKDVNKEDVVILGKSEEKCPECKGEMIVRIGRYGKFLSCSKVPRM